MVMPGMLPARWLGSRKPSRAPRSSGKNGERGAAVDVIACAHKRKRKLVAMTDPTTTELAALVAGAMDVIAERLDEPLLNGTAYRLRALRSSQPVGRPLGGCHCAEPVYGGIAGDRIEGGCKWSAENAVNPRPAEPPGSPTDPEPVDVPAHQSRRECWAGYSSQGVWCEAFAQHSSALVALNRSGSPVWEVSHMVELRPGESIAPPGAVVLTREQANELHNLRWTSPDTRARSESRWTMDRPKRYDPAYLRSEDVDAALTERDRRIAELEADRSLQPKPGEAVVCLATGEVRVVNPRGVELPNHPLGILEHREGMDLVGHLTALVNATLNDVAERNRRIAELEAKLEAATRAADKQMVAAGIAEVERDEAMRKLVLKTVEAEWTWEVGFEGVAWHLCAKELFGPDVANKLFPEGQRDG